MLVVHSGYLARCLTDCASSESMVSIIIALGGIAHLRIVICERPSCRTVRFTIVLQQEQGSFNVVERLAMIVLILLVCAQSWHWREEVLVSIRLARDIAEADINQELLMMATTLESHIQLLDPLLVLH